MNQPTAQIRALTPELLPDFLKFFDRTALENRARACERIDGKLMQIQEPSPTQLRQTTCFSRGS